MIAMLRRYCGIKKAVRLCSFGVIVAFDVTNISAFCS